VIAGLEPVAAGSVWIAGRDVTGWRPGRRNVAMVFQSYALFPHLTVRENIAFGLVVRDTPRAETVDRVARAAALTGCADLLDRRPGKLSGGERQRVALARALAREPDVFLLDEPMSNLDAELRNQTRGELKALHERVGGSIVHVTHDQVEALVLGDRVAVLRDGTLEQVGTPAEVYDDPATRFVAAFVGTPAMNLLPADGPFARWYAGALPADAELGVRPEHLRITAGGAEPVDRVDVIGSDAHVHLRLAGHPVVAKVPAPDRPRTGDRVAVEVRTEHVLAFDADGRRRR
jgi:multiple sugar transport system ATP-binding protein